MKIITDINDVDTGKVYLSLSKVKEIPSSINYSRIIRKCAKYFTYGFDFYRMVKTFKDDLETENAYLNSLAFDISHPNYYTVYELSNIRSMKSLILGLELLK